MKRIIIINGPNLNLLGQRETSIYGDQSFEEYFSQLENFFTDMSLEFFQSNIEGELINKIHEVGFTYDGIVLNAAGYTHTSVAIADALASVTTKVIEVHISNIYKREEFRHSSLTAKNCIGVIAGFGFQSYQMALDYFTKN